jgi:N-methylhydantoinase B
LVVESYGFVEDSGGAGKYRGGLGLRRVLRPVGHVATFTGQGERFLNQPWGIFGGLPGKTGRFLRRNAKGEVVELPTKPGLIQVSPDEAVIIETAAAGGYGDPALRDPALIERDLDAGKFSKAYVERNYPRKRDDRS